jgi:thymidylate kinase
VEQLVYIALEGLEGTGKTTVAPLVVQRLEQEGITCQTKPEFPGELYDSHLRDILSESLFISESLPMHPTASFFFMLYAESLASIGLDVLGSDVMIGDRCYYSIAIYQAYFAASSPQAFDAQSTRKAIHALYRTLEVPIPSRVFVLVAPLAECIRRLELREGRTTTERERGILESFSAIYRSFAAAPAALLVDAHRAPSEVVDEIARITIHDYRNPT